MIDEPIETFWNDEFGEHWEARLKDCRGLIHSISRIADPVCGWPPGQISEARVLLRQSLLKVR